MSSKAKKEIKALAKLKLVGSNWELFLNNRSKIINECVGLFSKNPETETEIHIEVKFIPLVKKASGKLGYFYAEIIPAITQGLIDAGNWDMTDRITYLFLCKIFLGEKINLINGEEVKEIKSVSDLNDDEMRIFLDACIKFGQNELNIRFQTPEEYRVLKNKDDSN